MHSNIIYKLHQFTDNDITAKLIQTLVGYFHNYVLFWRYLH